MSSQRQHAILAAILAIGLALRLPLMTESLWFDEYYTTSHTIGSVALLLKSLYSDIHPPAYYAFMWAWTNVFGDSELSIRTPPLLCGLATIALVFHVGRSFFGPRTGLVAAAILALAPVHLWYSTEGRPYSTQLFLLLLTVHAFGHMWRDDDGRGWRWVYGIALFTLVFTHYYMAAYAAAFSILALSQQMRHRRAILTANVIALALMAAYVGSKLLVSEFETERSYLRPFTPLEAWRLFFDWFLCGHTLTPDGVAPAWWRTAALVAFQLTAVVAVACGIARIRAQRSEPPAWHVLAHVAWLPLFLFVLTLVGRDRTYIERSVLPAYPFFAILLAAGLTTLRARNPIVVGFAVLQLASAVALFAERDVPTVYRPNPDWRAAAAYLASEIDAGATCTSVYTPYASPDVLGYYEERIQQARTFERNTERLERLLGAIDRRFGTGAPGAWARAFAERMIAEFDATRRHREAIAEMTVFWTHHHDPIAETDRSKPFYLVYTDSEIPFSPTARLAANPSIVEVERRRWRWIQVHKFRWND